MLYLELGLCNNDYLTQNECRICGVGRKFIWNLKSLFGIVLKKNIEGKSVYVIPNVKKKFLKKCNRLLDVTGAKQVCISNELFYRNELLKILKDRNIYICDGSWIIKYLLNDILNYISNITKNDFSNTEIAFLVDNNYELVTEYIKLFATKFKIITIATNNSKYFLKLEKSILEKYGIEINIVGNYRKGIGKADIVVNIDFDERKLKKCFFNNNCYFINFYNKYEIDKPVFKGINVTNLQIAIPDKYLIYAELFYNFNYLNVYESFIKKKTSVENILKEIKNDNLNIICLENESGLLKNEDFLGDMDKILDK